MATPRSPVGDDGGLREGAFHQQETEGLAAVARDHVGVAHRGHENGADEFAQRGAGKDVAVADGEDGGAVNQRVVVVVDLGIVAALGVVKDHGGGAGEEGRILSGFIAQGGSPFFEVKALWEFDSEEFKIRA